MTITITKWKLALGIMAVALIAPATALATHVFDDVDDGRFYAGPVEWAADNGITTGKTPTQFDPEGNVTRGESVTFLHRYDANIVQPALADRISHGEIVTTQGALATVGVGTSPATLTPYAAGVEVTTPGFTGHGIDGPAQIDGVVYALKSIEYCIGTGGLVVDLVEVWTTNGSRVTIDNTDRTAAGCYELADLDASTSTGHAFDVFMEWKGAGTVRYMGLRSTWVPASELS